VGTAASAENSDIALYGESKDNEAVAKRLKQAGYTNISTLSDALQQPDRLQKLPHFEQLVYPQWLHDLQQGKQVAAKPAGDVKVIEAAWRAETLSGQPYSERGLYRYQRSGKRTAVE
jgi:thiosulfate/3-mercaptopyruvate sulfurtransferase